MENKKSYPIGYVALATGLSPHVIRAWEKRYGAVTPDRAGKSRRLYSQKDIDRLNLLKVARSRGQRIGTAVELDPEALKRMGLDDRPVADMAEAKLKPHQRFADSSELLEECWDAVKRIDTPALSRGLSRAGTHLSRPALLIDVITPLMQKIGEGWAEGRTRIMHEHFASNLIRGFVWELIRSALVDEAAPNMVVTTPKGQLCEIGAMMAALTAADCGWKVHYFGPNLPAEEIAAAAIQESAEAVALSISCSRRSDNLEHELTLMRQALGDTVHILVGGRAAHAHQRAVTSAGGRYFENLHEFRIFIVQSG